MLLVFCIFPDTEKARELGCEMIGKGFAACVNLLPGTESIYKWKGEVQKDTETLAIFKVRRDGFSGLEEALLSSHPYDTPEIVGIAAEKVEQSYLDWVMKGD